MYAKFKFMSDLMNNADYSSTWEQIAYDFKVNYGQPWEHKLPHLVLQNLCKNAINYCVRGLNMENVSEDSKKHLQLFLKDCLGYSSCK